MPRKKLSPVNPSQDEGYSEEIQSDSSLESNSRRNARRKKPQREDSSKANRINVLLQSTNRKEKSQGNSSEVNGKRPSIIKIFRRIDRKSKNIYLVDDKIEDRNELLKPPEPKCYLNISTKGKSSRSIDSPCDKRSLFSNCKGQRSTTFKVHSNKTINTDRSIYSKAKDICSVEDKIKDRNELLKPPKPKCCLNIPNKRKSSRSIDSPCDKKSLFCNCKWHRSTTFKEHSIKTINNDRSERNDFGKLNVWNLPSETEASYAMVTNIDQDPNEVDVRNMHRDIDESYPSVTDIDKTPRSVCNGLLLRSDSNTSNSSEAGSDQISTAAEVSTQQSNIGFGISVSGSGEISNESDSGRALGRIGLFGIYCS